MNSLDQLNAYLGRLESRLRLAAWVRGLALAAAVALIATVLLVLAANGYAFAERVVTGARVALFLSLALAAAFGLAVPLLRLNRRVAAREAENKFPEFDQRLLTLAERGGDEQAGPFVDLLAADTLRLAEQAEPKRVVTSRRVLALASVATVAGGVLLWMGFAGPGFLGYGTSLLWAGSSREGGSPFYDIVIEPGNRSVRRGASQAVTARLVGFDAPQVQLFARYRSASKWEEAPMLPKEGGAGYEFLFAGIPETVDYYAAAGRVRSKTHTLSVRDLPAVKRIRVTYRFPDWTGQGTVVEDPGGDLSAVEGTGAEIAVETDRPLEGGLLVVDGSAGTDLNRREGNWSSGQLTIRNNGHYYVAARDQGELVRLSDDFFIEARKDSEPVLRIVRPGRDAKVSPIEEVTIAVEAEDDFGIQDISLRYSVNGGPEKTLPLPAQKGAKQAEGSAVIALEDYQLVPGDVVALYATARDARTAAKTDMYFLEAQPFEREYSQSQQMSSGGGEGGAENRISQRQKEIIAATWNQLRDGSHDGKSPADNARFLAEVQRTLGDQARSLARRMQSRQLSSTNQEFQSFSADMEKAAAAMDEAAGKLRATRWQDALAPEQKALQHLLRAEATFRQIQVAFGNQRGGQGGGSGRELESLFDLELDTEKNQYETGQQTPSASQRNREVDETLQRLEQLARRQQELAGRERQAQQSSQQRWQQEMLRREAEELQKRMEQLSRGSGESSGDQRLEQVARRLGEATRDMRQAGGSQGSGDAQARRAAERLREARDLMRGLRSEKSSGQLDDLARMAEDLAKRQREFDGRLQQAFGGPAPEQEGRMVRPRLTQEQAEQSRQLAEEKRQMMDDLARLERDMQDATRDLAGSQPAAAGKLRRALGNMQKEELALRMRYGNELLRRGYGQQAAPREAPITKGLEALRNELREARGALERGPSGQGNATRALSEVERLRGRLGAGPGRLGEQVFRESLRDLVRLRQSLSDIPEAAGDVEEIIGQMQRFDPQRVDEIASRILPALETMELRLRRKLDEEHGGQVRSGAPDPIPPGYGDAVAEYFRRLSSRK